MTCLSNKVELTAPRLARSSGSAINGVSAAHLLIEIDPYASMDEGDLIELFWDNCYVASKVLGADDIGAPIHLRVPESFICNGRSGIHYRVMQIGQDPARSATKRVQVKLDYPGGQPHSQCADENQGLAPLGIPEMIRKHGVNPNQMKRGVPVTIEPYRNMACDDAITLLWGDVRLDLPKLRKTDIDKPVSVFVPPHILQEAGEDAKLEVTYCVIDRVGNNSRWAPARILKVGAPKLYLNPAPREVLHAAEPRPNWRN